MYDYSLMIKYQNAADKLLLAKELKTFNVKKKL